MAGLFERANKEIWQLKGSAGDFSPREDCAAGNLDVVSDGALILARMTEDAALSDGVLAETRGWLSASDPPHAGVGAVA